MVVELAQLQLLCNHIQPVSSHFGKHGLTHNKGVYPCVIKVDALTLFHLIYHVGIITGIVGNKHGLVSAELHEHTERFCLVGCVCHISIADTCELGYLFGDMESRVHLGIEAVHHLQVFQLYSTYLGEPVISEAETSGLNVKNNYLVVKASVIVAVNDHITLNIIYDVSLHAVDDLEVLGHIVHTVRESLHAAVIGYRHGRMSPLCRPVYELDGVSDSVHC